MNVEYKIDHILKTNNCTKKTPELKKSVSEYCASFRNIKNFFSQMVEQFRQKCFKSGHIYKKFAEFAETNEKAGFEIYNF